MILIPSAAYIQGDLTSEFGRIPPAFLPLGNRPMFKHQIEMIRQTEGLDRIVLSVPEDFELDVSSSALLEKYGCETVRVPEGLQLGESILFSLNASGTSTVDSLRILHGDTYLSILPSGTDLVGIADTADLYNWQYAGPKTEPELSVWCGYFAFSDVTSFIRSLTVARGGFVAAVEDYRQTHPLRSVLVEGWMDAGHLNTYFRAREKFTTERHFNHLSIGEGQVKKSGLPAEKIRAEARWFQSLPPRLKKHTPQLLEVDESIPNYSIEYLPMPPLNELYVHGRLPEAFWNQVFSYCESWLSTAEESQHNDVGLNGLREELFENKTWSRLDRAAKQLDFDLDAPFWLDGAVGESVREMASHCVNLANSAPVLPGVMHGDFCFSNILLDSRGGSIKVIDPRGSREAEGLFAGEGAGLSGDLIYDLAKLAHSAVGKYDLIIADRFSVHGLPGRKEFAFDVHGTESHDLIANLFLSRGFLGINGSRWQPVLAVVALLFFTMIPLHSDTPTRQYAFLANAVRLYRDYLEE